MKKNISKLFSLALALIMALALAVPAMAAGTDGTIEISNATVGKTYAAYQVFEATYTGSGASANASYRISKDSPWYHEVSLATNYFTLQEIAGDSTKMSVIINEDNKAGVTTWLQGFVSVDEETKDIKVSLTQNSGDEYVLVPSTDAMDYQEAQTAEVTLNVNYGYYLVTSNLGSIVTVTNAKPNAEIIDKNQEPTWGDGGKTINDTTLQIGEEKEFTVKFTATNYDREDMITNYIVTDDMPNGMTLIKKNESGTDTTFTVTVNSVPVTNWTATYGTDDADDFTLTIPWTTTTDEGAEVSAYGSPVDVVVKYTVKLNDDAEIAGDGNTNKAVVSWTDKGTDPNPGLDEDSETVYTYALSIKKVNEDGDGLAGAEFVLKNGTDVVNVTELTGDDAGEKDANYYVVDPDGTATITSPASGLIIIKGVDSDTYTLTETNAPLGYNLLENPVTVEGTVISATTTNTTIYLDEDGNVVNEEDDPAVTVTFDVDFAGGAVAVLNKTGSLLPSTGGIGTTIFYTLGGLLAVGAVVLLVTKKRMSNAEG